MSNLEIKSGFNRPPKRSTAEAGFSDGTNTDSHSQNLRAYPGLTRQLTEWEYAQKEVPMNKITLISALLSAFLSFAAVAEEHADAALKHTNMAIQYGKAGHGPVFHQHASEALTQTKKAAAVAKDESKMHLEAAVKSLEEAIEQGKMKGKDHVSAATKAAEEAAEHLKAGNR